MYLAQCNFYAAHILQRTRLLYLVYMRTMQSQTRCDSLVCCLCFIFVLFFYFEFILGFGMKESTANLHSVLRLYCFKDQCATRHSVAIQWKIKSMMIAIIKFIGRCLFFVWIWSDSISTAYTDWTKYDYIAMAGRKKLCRSSNGLPVDDEPFYICFFHHLQSTRTSGARKMSFIYCDINKWQSVV